MRGLISFINDNHMENSLKDFSVYVYFGSIVKYRSKIRTHADAHMHTHTNTKQHLMPDSLHSLSDSDSQNT